MPCFRYDICFLLWETVGGRRGYWRSRRPRRTARRAAAKSCGHRRPPPRLAEGTVPQVWQAQLPLRARGCAGTWPLLVVDLVGQGYREVPRPHHSCRCHRRNAGPDRRIPAASWAGARSSRGQRPAMRCQAGRGQAGHAGKKGGLGAAIAEEIEAEVERLIGEGVVDDFQAIETEARRVALQIMRQAVAHRLNADHSTIGDRACRAGADGRGTLRAAGPRSSPRLSAP